VLPSLAVFFLFWQGLPGKSTQKWAHFEGKKKLEVASFPKEILITRGLLTTKTAPFSIA
jgi:hypothetical protein